MIKKIFWITLMLVLVGGLVFGAVNRTLAKTGAESQAEAVEAGNGYGNGNSGANANAPAAQAEDTEPDGVLNNAYVTGNDGQAGAGNGQANQAQAQDGSALPAADPDGLSAEEAAALTFMREEEKLARDVYAALYAQWGTGVFRNIGAAEQAHMDSVLALLERYEVADPASSQAGVFTDPELQALYNDLVARGSQSVAEALKVGAAIEEIDILDLQERLAQTDNTDIQQVFGSLLAGSENHLRAFVRVLANQTGEVYQPVYMSAEAYAAMVTSAAAQGNGQGQNGQGGQGQGGKP